MEGDTSQPSFSASAAKSRLRVVFMGTAEISDAFLDEILSCDEVELVGVLTQPDTKRGRSNREKPSLVRTHVESLGRAIPVITPKTKRLNSEEDTLGEIESLHADIFVVVAFGRILGERLLSMPRLGCLNIHLSDLPNMRGAAPIEWSIINGRRETGITAMLMDRGMDTGDILIEKKTPILDTDDYSSLTARLIAMGRPIMVEAIRQLRDGTAVRTPQDHRRATTCRKFTKFDYAIDWSMSADSIIRRIRALSADGCTVFLPAPTGGIKAGFEPGELMKVFAAAPGDAAPAGADVGTLVGKHKRGPEIMAGDGRSVRLTSVRPQGKGTMDGASFMNGIGRKFDIGAQFFPGATVVYGLVSGDMPQQ